MEAATLTRTAGGCRAATTDDELVSAVRAGDERAFEELYARYQRRIAAYVLGMVKDHQRAEDVTQEVFMSALRRMRQTDRPIAFKPWIYEIAKNACIDQFRRSKRTDEVSYDCEESGVGPLVSGGPTPDMALHARQDLDNLRGAFVGLNDSHHKILVMRELEGRSYAEIGQRLGMTRPAVESTLFRARKRLAEEYDELVSGERCRRVQTIIATADEGSLGARDQRRMARHVSYCQPCRRAAALAGLGELVPARTGVRAKIAGLVPLPIVLRDRWMGTGSHHAAAVDGAGAGGTVAGWLHAAGPILDAGGGGWMKAMATAATVAVAGVGAGAVTGSERGLAAGGGLPDVAARVAAISASGNGAAAGPGATRSAANAANGAATGGGASGSGATGGSGSGAAGRAGAGVGSATRPASNGAGTTSGSGEGAATPAGDPAATDPTADPAGTVGAVAADPGTAPSAVSGTADSGRRTVGKRLPPVTVLPPSTPAGPVGDTQAKVPTPADVTSTADQAPQQAGQAIDPAIQQVQNAGATVTNALPAGG